MKLRTLIKKFVDYTIENDIRIFQLKHTPIKIKMSLTRAFLKRYGELPVVPEKIVCNNYRGSGYGCNSKYVVELLLKSGRPYDIVWVVEDVKKSQKDFPKEIRLVKYLSKEAMYEYATAGVWLCNYHLVDYFRRGLTKKEKQTYIQMWHGSFGIKRIENDCGFLNENKRWTYLAKKNAKSTDYWISNSMFETEVYQSAFWGAETVLEYGHPRNDIFFRTDTETLRRRVNAYLELDDTEKIILYVPTFREEWHIRNDSLDVSMVCDALRQITAEEFRFVVRFHPRMKKKERTAFLGKWKQAIDATDYPDIQELLLLADVDLPDYSSCVFDYLLSGKMAFMYIPDRDAYIEERGFYYPPEESPLPVAETNQKLCENIRNFDIERYQARIQAFLQEKGSKETGRASKAVAELVVRTVGEQA